MYVYCCIFDIAAEAELTAIEAETLAKAADKDVAFGGAVAVAITDEMLASWADKAELVAADDIIALMALIWEAKAGLVAVAKYEDMEAICEDKLAALIEALTEAKAEDIEFNWFFMLVWVGNDVGFMLIVVGRAVDMITMRPLIWEAKLATWGESDVAVTAAFAKEAEDDALLIEAAIADEAAEDAEFTVADIAEDAETLVADKAEDAEAREDDTEADAKTADWLAWAMEAIADDALAEAAEATDAAEAEIFEAEAKAVDWLAWTIEAIAADALTEAADATDAAETEIFEAEAKAAETLAEAHNIIEEISTVGVAVTVWVIVALM